MAESVITDKGRTTMPAAIRALVHAKPGSRLVWTAMAEAPEGKHVSVEDMNPWR